MKPSKRHPFVLETAAFLARHSMLGGVRQVCAAVSGGADSMALLHVLTPLRAELGFGLAVAHVNHGLRGAESDLDEAFVRDAAARLALPFHLHKIAPGEAPASGIEEWGRHQRLAFLQTLLREGHAERVATGHTQRDQAETVLFRLLRGAGPSGLGAMAPVSASCVVRPLLWATREEVLGFLNDIQAEWREDTSNFDARFARNRLRHHWLPALREAWNPQLDRALAATAELLSEENAYLNRIADDEVARIFRESQYGWESDVSDLQALPVALQRRVLRELSRRTGHTTLAFPLLESVRDLATGAKGWGRVATKGFLAERSGGRFRAANAQRVTPAGVWESQLLDSPGRFPLPDSSGTLELDWLPGWTKRMNGFNGLNSGYTEGWSFLRPARLGCALRLRPWLPGDAFRPLGLPSIVKLKELFQRRAVPIWRRAGSAVLEIDGQIAWSQHFGTSAEHGLAGQELDETLVNGHSGFAIRVSETGSGGKTDEWESTSESATS